MATSFWKRWLNRVQGGKRTPNRRGEKQRRQHTILHVEALEARTVPSTITQWTFEGLAQAVNNSPAPSTGTGTASGLGMTNSFKTTSGTGGSGSTNTDDIVQGVTGDTGSDNLADLTKVWRIRGQNPGNGWSSQAAIGTQGAEFAASTVGYTSINVSFDWYATTQGEGKLQFEYTTNGGTTWTNVAITVPAADNATTVHTNPSSGGSANTVIGSYVQVSGQNWSPNLTATISDANAANDPNFAIELVNASTGADCVNTAGAALNNNSGNWRFDNVTISGTVQPASPTVTSPTANPVGINTATLGGTVTSIGSQPVTQYGVVYALTSSITAQNPLQIGNTGVFKAVDNATLSINSPFTVSVSGLAGTSGYSYAAYATNSVGTSYSSVSTFTTQSANAPTVDTPSDTQITGTSATLGGTVETDGGAAVSESGIVYALASNSHPLTIGSTGVTKVDTSSPIDNGTSPAPAFTVPVSGLSFNTAYVFAAFATNSSGTTYSSPATQFTTQALPTVANPTVTALTANSATLGGDVTSTGSATTLSQSGVIYALTSNPHPLQLGSPGVTELDTGGTTGIFTVPATGLSGATSYTFEAFATSSVGTSYTAATSFTTAAPGVIAAWTFPTTTGGPDNSPAPTYGTGTATTLGMTNNYTNLAGTGANAIDDVLSTSGTANANFTENLWRIRGTQPSSGTTFGNNGWALAAPEYTQGVELDTSTVGYSNIVFAFDWFSTKQGIRDLQVQYNTNINNANGWTNYNSGDNAAGTFIATSNDYYNAGLSPANPTIYINLSNIAAASGDPNLGIRLVSAYDSTGTLGNVYASATSTPGNIVPYNNSSGNWRFGNLTFYGNLTTTSTTLASNPTGGGNPGANVMFTATVTPASGTQFPSGTIAFFDGSNQIGTTQSVTQVGSTNVGTASITLNTLTAGLHNITAQYTPTVGNGLIASGSSMSQVVGDPTDNPIAYSVNAPLATGVDIAPVVGQPFTGVVATFSDGTNTSPTGMTAKITWATGQTTNGVIAFSSSENEKNINGQIVTVNVFTVTGTYTFATAGSFPVSVAITDAFNNSTTVSLTARVAYPPLVVTGGLTITAGVGLSLNNQTVATFTDPGLVANLSALTISDPTTQFSASICWGDGSANTAGTITYNATTHVFSVNGSHTYSQTGAHTISVYVTPLTVSVSRVDSSDPNSLNEVGDEDGNGITDSPSAAFIDQFVTDPGNSTLQNSLYAFSLPTVQTTSGNAALTYSSYSKHEGALNLSTNGQYLVIGGYNLTVNAWGPQSTFSQASVINRVIDVIDGQGDINTTTALTDAYSGDNFRDVVSSIIPNPNGPGTVTAFWTAGNATDSSNNVHYAALDATTSTNLSALADANNIAIFNGQLYAGLRQPSGSEAAGIYQIGTGLPTTATTATLFIQVPQNNALDSTDGDKSTSPSGLFMADLNDGNPTINGVNVAYIADSEMGIARYDHTSTGWQFSYYIDSTGSFNDSAYTVDGSGNVTPTASFDPTNPAGSADLNKAGGVRELTGRVVNGQVQLFAVTGFGTGANPSPTGGTAGDAGGFADSVISLTDTGANSSFAVLATNTGASIYDGVAFTPTQTLTTTANVLTDVTSRLKVQKTGPSYNRVTGNYAAGLILTNMSSSAITGGFRIELTNLTAGATLKSASITVNGVMHTYTPTADPTTGAPAFVIPASVIPSLAAGKALPTITLTFTSSVSLFSYGLDVFSDPLGV